MNRARRLRTGTQSSYGEIMTNPLKRYFEGRPKGAKAALARKLGWSKGALGDIIHGRREPTLDQARALDAATCGDVAFASWKEPSASPPAAHAAHDCVRPSERDAA